MKMDKPKDIAKKQKAKRAKKFTLMMVQVALLAALLFFFGYAAFSTMQEIAATEAEIATLSLSIDGANQEAERLRADSEYRQSEAFIERIARQWLGLVRRDEIIFIIED